MQSGMRQQPSQQPTTRSPPAAAHWTTEVTLYVDVVICEKGKSQFVRERKLFSAVSVFVYTISDEN